MRYLLTVLILAGMAVPTVAAEPVDAVRPFYEHIGLEYDDDSLDLFVDPARAVLEGDRRMAEEGDICLDFLLAIDGQDHDEGIAASLELIQTVDGDQAEVVASFSNFGYRSHVDWRLVNRDGWKIADIGSRANGWLSELSCD